MEVESSKFKVDDGRGDFVTTVTTERDPPYHSYNKAYSIIYPHNGRVARCPNCLLYEAMKLGKLNIDPLLMCVIKTGRKLRPSKESLIGFVLRARQLKEQGGNSVENGKLKVENDPDIG